MLRPRAYGKFGNITLVQFPSDEAPDIVTNQEMYNAFTLVLDRFKNENQYSFLNIFCRDVIDHGMKEYTPIRNFMAHYVVQKLSYGRTLTTDMNFLEKVLGNPGAWLSVGFAYTEEMIDGFVDKWREHMLSKLEEYYNRFRSVLHEPRWRDSMSEELYEPINFITNAISFGWNPTIVKPDFNIIRRIVSSHIELVRAAIHDVEWYIREKFLTIQWTRDPRVTSWERARNIAKQQSNLEKSLVQFYQTGRYDARKDSQSIIEDTILGLDSEEFDPSRGIDGIISAHISELMKKKCVIKDEKKKKKNIPRRKKVIKKEEEEGGFFF